jgi:hypothetical protein
VKRIIDGLRYDTETALKVAEWDNGRYNGDFELIEEALYKTKSGRWFLAAYGGALTEYSEPAGNNGRCAGSRVIPFTAYEAQKWLEGYGFTNAIEKHFSADVKDA